MFKFILVGTLCLAFMASHAQKHICPDTLSCTVSDKVYVKLLSSDSLSSTFFIVVPGQIKQHYHQYHTENIFVVSGKAEMQLGEATIQIKKGDLIIVPKGTRHSVKRIGRKSLKVISVQSPLFDGTDRIMLEN